MIEGLSGNLNYQKIKAALRICDPFRVEHQLAFISFYKHGNPSGSSPLIPLVNPQGVQGYKTMYTI